MSKTADSTVDAAIAVVGAGAMGRGIAETAAAAGLTVVVVETSAVARSRAVEQIQRSLSRAVDKGKLTQAAGDDVLARLKFVESLDATADCCLAIEAVPEDESLKREVFQRLDSLLPNRAILASNTSSISITRLAAATKRPAQVVGMHFFNPVPVMAPVEVVRGLQTSDETVDSVVALAKTMGKQPLIVRDQPGFVVNRVLMPLINEAVFTLQEGTADAATIDELLRLGCNHPMGPLQLADFVGLDVCLSILRVLHAELGDPKFRPCPLLVQLVDAGRLGRKSGWGFYRY